MGDGQQALGVIFIGYAGHDVGRHRINGNACRLGHAHQFMAEGADQRLRGIDKIGHVARGQGLADMEDALDHAQAGGGALLAPAQGANLFDAGVEGAGNDGRLDYSWKPPR